MGGWELGANHKDAFGASTLEANLSYKRGTNDFDSIPAPEELFGEGTSKLGLMLLDLRSADRILGLRFTKLYSWFCIYILMKRYNCYAISLMSITRI